MIDTNPTPIPAELDCLINRACDLHNIAENVRDSAKELDPRALKRIGEIVSSGSARLMPIEIHEITRWGVNWHLSSFPCLRALA